MNDLPIGDKVANAIPVIQGLYNQFQTIGVTISIEDVPLIYQNCKRGDHLVFSNYCQDKLLALPAYANVVSLGLDRNKTLAMVTLPDFEFIRDWILNDPAAQFVGGGSGITPTIVSYLTIVNGLVRYKS